MKGSPPDKQEWQAPVVEVIHTEETKSGIVYDPQFEDTINSPSGSV